MIRKTLLFILIWLPLGCFAQGSMLLDSTTAKKVTAKMVGFLTEHTIEKAYLQFDKPYYAAGDTIYLKAYVTLGEYHELSNLSGVLHIDLINPANQVSQSIKLKLSNGLAWGDFALPDTLTKGQYHIRAYTQFMRNGGETAFFDQAVIIASLKNAVVVASVNKPEIGFFPEGGTFVQGINSKIAFKAINSNGLGAEVKGVVIDNDNKEVASFASTHFGMGYFSLNPSAGKSYKARVSYPNGSQTVVDLPAADAKGIALSVADAARYATLSIQANKTYFQDNKDKFFTLFVYGGGAATSMIARLDNETIKLAIDKQQFPTGIIKATLFSQTSEPIAERLLFIQNHDQLKLDIRSDKPQYAKREITTITVNIKDKQGKPVEGHFSASVVDQSKVPADESAGGNILSSLLITSDLAGYVEKPAYYFNNIASQTNGELDLVMLTHGYRRFEWRKLMGEGYPADKVAAEKDLEITGTVKTNLGKPITNTNITITSKDERGIFTKDTVTDAAGSFKFSRLSYTDNTRFLLKTKEGKNVVINYNEEPGLPVKGYDGLLNTEAFNFVPNNLASNNNPLPSDNGKLLKEVKVNDSKTQNAADPVEIVKSLGNKVFYGKDMIQDAKLSTALNQIGAGLDFRSSAKNVKKGIGHNPFDLTNLDIYLPGGSTPALLIVDGVEYQGNIDDFSADIISSVEILDVHSQSKKFYGALNKTEGGVIVINTDRNKVSSGTKTATGGTLYITPQGFYKARVFYTPKYENVTPVSNRADLRSTISWQPELFTDKNGNVSFTYPNADGTGNYQVTIEGIDNAGNIGSMRYTYKVQ